MPPWKGPRGGNAQSAWTDQPGEETLHGKVIFVFGELHGHCISRLLGITTSTYIYSTSLIAWLEWSIASLKFICIYRSLSFFGINSFISWFRDSIGWYPPHDSWSETLIKNRCCVLWPLSVWMSIQAFSVGLNLNVPCYISGHLSHHLLLSSGFSISRDQWMKKTIALRR